MNLNQPCRDFAYECHIRDCFAENLNAFRPDELLSKREVSYQASNVRADLRTVNSGNIIYEWEFKIEADYSSIGQIMTYVAFAKTQFHFQRTVRPVIAAFSFPKEIKMAIEVNNLAIEMFVLPAWMRGAGIVPSTLRVPPRILIPRWS